MMIPAWLVRPLRRAAPAVRHARIGSLLGVAIGCSAFFSSADRVSAAPDRLVYGHEGPALSYKLFVADASGANARQLGTPTFGEKTTALSPDGQTVAYAEAGTIYVGSLRQWSPRAIYVGGSKPQFSPDGKSLVFIGTGSNTGADIRAINVDGTNLRSLVTWKGQQEDPHYSPDGTKIVFSSTSSPKGSAIAQQIFMTSSTGANPVQLTVATSTLLSAGSPAFSPDGTAVAFSGQSADVNKNGGGDDWDIMVIGTNGTNLRYAGPRSSAREWEVEWFPYGGGKLVFDSQTIGLVYNYSTVHTIDLTTGTEDTLLGGSFGYSSQSPSYRQPSTVYGLFDYLAAEFQPRLRFDTSESWRPLNVDTFFAEKDALGNPYHKVCDVTCIGVTSAASLRTYPNSTAVLDINGSGSETNYHSPTAACNTVVGGTPRRDCDSGSPSAIYYRISNLSPGGYQYLDYWFFYRYNYYSNVLTTYNHEADWEGVTIGASHDANATFDFVSFSQHGVWYSYLRDLVQCDGAGYLSCGRETSKTGTRVDVYVANGTHADYPSACAELLPDQCKQQDGLTPERGHDGAYPWGRNEDSTALIRMPAAAGWPSGNWTDWPGKWGAGGSGISSPANQNPHWATPWGNPCAGDGSPCATLSRRKAWAARAALPPLPSKRVASAAGSRVRSAAPWVKYCGDWFGPDIAAVACEPRALNTAVDQQALHASGSLRLELAGRRRRSSSAPGLAQLAGRPLRVGDTVLIRGQQRGAVVFVRVRDGRRIVEARFAGRNLLPGNSARVTITRRGGRIMLRLLHNGRVTRPAQTRTIV